MIRHLENVVFALRIPILIGLIGVTAVAFWIALGLRVDSGFYKQLPTGHEYVETFMEYAEKQFGSNRIILVLREKNDCTFMPPEQETSFLDRFWNFITPGTGGNLVCGLNDAQREAAGAQIHTIWNQTFLSTLNGLTQDTFFMPGADRRTVQSLWTPNTRYLEITEEGISASDVIPGTTTPATMTGRAIDQLRNNVIRGGFVGRLVSNDFTAALVVTDILEYDQKLRQKLDYFDLGMKLERLRERYEGPGGPALYTLRDRLETLRLKFAEQCPPPDTGTFDKIVSSVSGDIYIPTCGDFGADMAAEINDLKNKLGPVTGAYLPTFEQDLAKIRAENLPSADQYARLNTAIQTWTAATASEVSPYEVHIIGFGKAAGDIAAGAKEVMKFFAVAFFLTVLSLYYYCRSWKLTFLTVGCSLVSVIWQFAALVVLGYGLDPLAILVPFLVFAIGVSHGVQQLNLISSELAKGETPEKAARTSFSALLIPGSAAFATTIIGFATLYLVPIPMIQELAVASTIGVMFKVVTNLVMMPLIASMMRFKPSYAARVLAAREARLRLVRALGFFGEKWVAITMFFVYAIAFGFALEGSSHRHIGNVHAGVPELNADHRFNYDANTIAGKFNQALDILTIIVETPQQACIKYPYMDYVNRFSWAMQNTPGVLSVLSTPFVAKQINAGWYEGNLKWRALPRNYYSLVQATGPIPGSSGLINTDCTLLPLQIFLIDGKATTINRVVQAVKDWRNSHPLPPALSAGHDNKDGTWLLRPADLNGLKFRPQFRDAENPRTSVTLTVTGYKVAGDGTKTEIFSGAVPVTLGEPFSETPLDIKAALPDADIASASEIVVGEVPQSLYIRLASGNAGATAAINEEIEFQEVPMTVITYFFIVLCVIFTFRDWRASIATIIPLIYATFFGFWFMAALDIGMKVSTLPVVTLAVGLGVDYAFYIYNRIMYWMGEGLDITQGYKKSMMETGNAMIFTAVTLAIGVSTWAFSDLKFQADMGIFLTFMFMIGMFNAVTGLPAVAIMIEMLFPRRKPVPKQDSHGQHAEFGL